MAKIIRFIGENGLEKDLALYFLKSLGNNVLLVDSSPASREIPIKLGVENELIYDIYDLLNMDLDLDQAMISLEDESYFIGAPYFADKNDFSQEDLDKFFEKAASFSYILFVSNDLFNGMDFKDAENIVLSDKDFNLPSYYVSDVEKEKRIGSLKEFDARKIFENYTNKKEYKEGFVSKLRRFFS